MNIVTIYIFQEDITCEDIVNSTQCSSESPNTLVNDKCGLYTDDVCKLRCEYVTVEEADKCNERTDECFWVKGNISSTSQGVSECKEKV
jgi:hypothetical protein